MSDRVAMAKAIRAAREAAGLTQQQLATRLGRSIANIRAWERITPPATIPGGAIARQLAETLGVTLDALHIGNIPPADIFIDGTMRELETALTCLKDCAYYLRRSDYIRARTMLREAMNTLANTDTELRRRLKG